MRPLARALVCTVVVACHRGAATTAGDAAIAAPSSPPAAATSASSTPAPLEDERARRWREARSGDPLELARLADVEGCDGLLDALDDADAGAPAANEDDRLTALRALAFVDDPTPALDALTRAALGRSSDGATVALQTLASITPKRAQREEDDTDAWKRCGDALLAGSAAFTVGARRELWMRALLGLADRGAIDRAKVPAK